ncbi:MAG: hypothetical protein SFU25_08670, partial [Candidatus Caenarcaniphilales bacterium]|nr:hypothetical protein [Candidatus Caenarcaniphilales bacterium]
HRLQNISLRLYDLPSSLLILDLSNLSFGRDLPFLQYVKHAPLVSKVIRTLLLLPNVFLVNTFYSWNLIEQDPDDNKFVDCAVSSNVDYLVTNDKDFNVLKAIDFPKVNLLNIEEFIEMLS